MARCGAGDQVGHMPDGEGDTALETAELGVLVEQLARAFDHEKIGEKGAGSIESCSRLESVCLLARSGLLANLLQGQIQEHAAAMAIPGRLQGVCLLADGRSRRSNFEAQTRNGCQEMATKIRRACLQGLVKPAQGDLFRC